MKYLRLFELFEPEKHKFNNKEYYKIYWLLPTDKRFKDALKKINCNEYFMNELLTKTIYRESAYIFIGYTGTTPVTNIVTRWGWNEYKSELTDYYYEKYGYKFGGAINIPDWEFNIKKYNL
jgi:hypothetical protein